MMANKFKELRSRMTPEQRAESAALAEALLGGISVDELRREVKIPQEDLCPQQCAVLGQAESSPE